jgi:trimethylamine:corrinoid methyltransferase-like protein
MTIRTLLAILLFYSTFLVAAEKPHLEQFAIKMISCASKTSAYSDGLGTQAARQKARAESTTYLAAAVKATSAQFVEAQTPGLIEAAEKTVIEELKKANSNDETISLWNAHSTRCGALLRSQVAP